MSSEEQNIFNPGRELTREEIDAYLAGNLSPEQMNEVERIAAASPMSADALEGVRMAGSSATVDQITREVAMKSGFLSTATFKIVGFIGLAVVIGLVVFLNETHEQPNQNPEQVAQQVVEPDEEPLPVEDAQEESALKVVETEATDSSVSIFVNASQSPSDIPSDEPFIHELEIPADKLESIVILDVPIEDEDPVEEPIPGASAGPGQDIYHLLDYRVVDYTELRKEEFNVLYNNLGGVPAAYASEWEMENEQPQILQIAYVDYLREAMGLFSSGKYKAAENKFKTILKKYPDDANALFYGGMSLYRLGKNHKAVKRFEASLELDIRTFEQESAFYMALSLLADGDRDRAFEILEEIVEQGGFYAEQAQEILEKG